MRSMTGSEDRTCGRTSASCSSGSSLDSGNGEGAPSGAGQADGAMPRDAKAVRNSGVAASPASQRIRGTRVEGLLGQLHHARIRILQQAEQQLELVGHGPGQPTSSRELPYIQRDTATAEQHDERRRQTTSRLT